MLLIRNSKSTRQRLDQNWIMDWIIENKQWLFSGIGVFALGLLITLMQKKTSGNTTASATGTNTQKNSINIYNNPTPPKPNLSQQDDESDDDLQALKDKTRILFIDDDDKFKVVKILKSSGWIHTSLTKDLGNLDQNNVTQATILFVDIQGVGLKLGFSDEGLGLAKALKERYSEKFVIIYSSQTQGDRFHEALRLADESLEKNADPYQFQQLVEKFARQADINSL